MQGRGLVMLFKDEMPWHMLLYRLKKEQMAGDKPNFLRQLRFDWNGPYPKCQELSRFIQALHWTGTVGAVNPSYEKIVLHEDVGKLWAEFGEKLDGGTKAYLDHAADVAKEEFPAEGIAAD